MAVSHASPNQEMEWSEMGYQSICARKVQRPAQEAEVSMPQGGGIYTWETTDATQEADKDGSSPRRETGKAFLKKNILKFSEEKQSQ